MSGRDPLVRHNEDTHRYVTACVCGRTISMPEDGLATHICDCKRVWKSNGYDLSMWTPKGWRVRGIVDHG